MIRMMIIIIFLILGLGNLILVIQKVDSINNHICRSIFVLMILTFILLISQLMISNQIILLLIGLLTILYEAKVGFQIWFV